MLEPLKNRDLMYPKLSAEQISRLSRYGHFRTIPAGEVLFAQGQQRRAIFVLIEGRVEVWRSSPEGETPITVVTEPGEFTGETDLLSGRPSLVRGRGG